MAFVRRHWLALLVALAASRPYLSVIDDYFIQDDFGTVMILTRRAWTTFPRWFTMVWMEDIWGAVPDEIRPFVAFTYQLTGKWAPHRPELHHIFNIALHAGNALLVMAIGRRALHLPPLAAAFAGLMFAVLPSQIESAAWITGRVDSMPAFFYLATFLAYVRWREDRLAKWYAASLALFFVTLFSKQNAITMAASLAAYDLLVLDRARRGTLVACVKAWAPFILMTAGYLALRRVVLGQSVRGGVQSWHAVETFFGVVERHVYRVATGHLPPLSDWETAGAVVILLLCVVAAVVRPSLIRLLAFCAAWWIIGTAPLLVVGYESPRHVYLASAAWVYLLALIGEAALQGCATYVATDVAQGFSPARSAALKGCITAIAAAAVALTGVYLVRLHRDLQDWHALADVSKTAVDRMRDEALAAPDGTLFLVSVPTKSWEWGIPFVLQPPYQQQDLAARVRVVTPWRLHCCGPDRWRDYALRQLRDWQNSAERPPLVALHFAPRTGAVARATDAENGELRALIPVLLETDTPEALDGALTDLLERVAARAGTAKALGYDR